MGVAVLTTLLLTLVRHAWPDSAPSPHEPPPPSELTVDVRGGSPSPEGAHIRSFSPHDHLDIVARHNGQRTDETRLLVRAQPLSSARTSTSGSEGPELYIALDPRHVVWQEHSLRYRGRVDETLPLAPGLWRLTFMLCDRRECERGPLHVCAQFDAWLRVRT